MVQFPYDARLRNLLSTLIICTMVVHQALCKFQTVIHGTEYNMILISNLESKTDKYEVIIIWKMQTPMDIITISTINCFFMTFLFQFKKNTIYKLHPVLHFYFFDLFSGYFVL